VSYVKVDVRHGDDQEDPCSSEMEERSVIASIAADPGAFGAHAGDIRIEDFVDGPSREALSIVLDIVRRGGKLTRAMILTELRAHALSPVISEAISGMLRDPGDPQNLALYLERIRAPAALRQLRDMSHKVIAQINNGLGGSRDLIGSMASALAELGARLEPTDRRGTIGDSASNALDESISLRDNDQSLVIKTHFNDLDNILCPWMPGDVSILAARPSMGKTAFALGVADNIATQDLLSKSAGPRHGVVVFSMEMSRSQLAGRLLSAKAKVDYGRLIRGHITSDEEARCRNAIAVMSGLDIVVHDMTGLTPLAMRGAIQHEKADMERRGSCLSLAVVDYLQLMEPDHRRAQSNRTESITEISRGMKKLAMDEKIPLLVLSQMNRSVESRQDHRPQLSDLRESGAIEQDADKVIFLHNEYIRTHDPADRGRVEVIIAKQRNGPVGSAVLSFDGTYVRFGNYRNPSMVLSNYAPIGPGSRDYFNLGDTDLDDQDEVGDSAQAQADVTDGQSKGVTERPQ